MGHAGRTDGPAGREELDTGGRHELTAGTGLAALSLDAMASVAYDPEAIALVLAAASRPTSPPRAGPAQAARAAPTCPEA